MAALVPARSSPGIVELDGPTSSIRVADPHRNALANVTVQDLLKLYHLHYDNGISMRGDLTTHLQSRGLSAEAASGPLLLLCSIIGTSWQVSGSGPAARLGQRNPRPEVRSLEGQTLACPLSVVSWSLICQSTEDLLPSSFKLGNDRVYMTENKTDDKDSDEVELRAVVKERFEIRREIEGLRREVGSLS